MADVKGYVYEKADIVKHIQNEKRERGICICPVASALSATLCAWAVVLIVSGMGAGRLVNPCVSAAVTQHQITVEGLKKAAHVIRAQKQKRRHAEKTSQNPESRSHRGDVLDID